MTACVANVISERKATAFYTKTMASRFLAIECAACGMGASFNYSPKEMKPEITKHQVENGFIPKYIKQKRDLCNFLKLSGPEYCYDPDDPERARYCPAMAAWLNAQEPSTLEVAE